MSNKNLKSIITIIILILLLISLYYFLSYFTKNKNSNNDEYLRNYGVNEYIPTYVSDESMASIYLEDYIKNVQYNIEESYYLLDEEYRNAKFQSYESYYNYVKDLVYKKVAMKSFYKKIKDGYTIFGVYDKDNNFYGFKTNGVMQYSVYLDSDTLEIGG